MQDNQYDLAVLGGGAGGLFTASVANALGVKMCIIEKRRLGGDCTWFGCMPSKAILKSAYAANLLKKSSGFGLKIQGDFQISTNGVMSHVRDVIQEIATHHEPQDLLKRGIDVLFGSPRFVDANSVEVNGKRIDSKRFIIATGSHPAIPPIEGLKDVNYLCNENIFDLNELPKSLIVLGGGPIGVELSQALHRLGTQVTIVEMAERILLREEPELGQIVEERLKKEGLKILTGKKAVRVAKNNGQVTITLEDTTGRKEDVMADNVLVAVGRAPNIEGLDLEKANVEFSNKGIEVNEYLQTTNPDIFACGDVVGPYQFSHVAAYQAGICVRNALFRRLVRQRVNYNNMVWATFTDPELAHLGMTEKEAREKYRNIKVYISPYTSSDRAVTDMEKEGLVKVVTDKKGIILGAHIVGANAGEIIQGFIIVKSLRTPLNKIAQMLFIYPTLSELIKKTATKSFIEKASNPLVKILIKLMKAI